MKRGETEEGVHEVEILDLATWVTVMGIALRATRLARGPATVAVRDRDDGEVSKSLTVG